MSNFLDINLKLHELGKLKQHYVQGKKGDGAMYIDLRIIETPDSEWQDAIVVRKVSKEDRAKGVQGEIVGTVKDWSKHQAPAQQQSSGNDNDNAPVVEGAEDLPF